MSGGWHSGIFHGPGRSLRQNPDLNTAQDVIERAIVNASDQAMESFEKRYRAKLDLAMGALLLTAAATAVIAIIMVSKEV